MADKSLNPVPPTYGPATEEILDEARMVTPAPDEEPGEATESDAKGGGRISTHMWSEGETRPQELHGSVAYQEENAQPGQKPPFISYTNLTRARGIVEE